MNVAAALSPSMTHPQPTESPQTAPKPMKQNNEEERVMLIMI